MKKWTGALLIAKSGEAILQKRDINPNIINSGKITLFGGSVEGLESPEECLKREIREELGINITDFSYFGLYKKRKSSHGENCDCYVYLIKDVDLKKINVNEGLGYALVFPDNKYLTSEYSLITQSVLSDYFKKDK
jgi:8-oxo-dGTP pyrophosphatase MutT (NUDIX family)